MVSLKIETTLIHFKINKNINIELYSQEEIQNILFKAI